MTKDEFIEEVKECAYDCFIDYLPEYEIEYTATPEEEEFEDYSAKIELKGKFYGKVRSWSIPVRYYDNEVQIEVGDSYVSFIAEEAFAYLFFEELKEKHEN